MCKKIYNSAPLPFMGQKRRFVKDFKEVLKSTKGITTIVDLFRWQWFIISRGQTHIT